MAVSSGQMQFAMGGGGGSPAMGGGEGGFAQHVESAPLLAFLLPHGHQSILSASREGLFGAKLSPFGNLFEAHGNKGLFGDLMRRLSSAPMTNGALEIGPMSYGEGAPIEGPPISGVPIEALGSFSPGGPRGGGSLELA